MKTLGIIPARYSSTRFPGKPLAFIGNKSMIRRVYENASGSDLDKVIVATDDERIYNHVRDFQGNVVMTSPNHTTGTARCSEVAANVTGKYDLVINIQGDEPFIRPELLNQLIRSFDKSQDDIATPVKRIITNEELFSPDKVKVIRNENSHAIYFSRTPVPYIRGIHPNEWHRNFDYFLHIGIYAFRMDVLFDLIHFQPSGLETAESLEQLTWIYHGFKIKIVETDYESISIDTPEDLKTALKYLELTGKL